MADETNSDRAARAAELGCAALVDASPSGVAGRPWGGDTVMPFAANTAVEIGGVCVVPGDCVHADATGGVVIPAARQDDVLAEAARIEAARIEAALIEAEDAEFADCIRAEDPAALRAGSRAGTGEER